MKYRKKPVVIEAVEWTGENHREMFNFLTGKTEEYIASSDDQFYIDHSQVKGGLILKTLEGEHIASIGDMVIKGISGEFYPCKPDIFELTYESVVNEEKRCQFCGGEESEDAMIKIDHEDMDETIYFCGESCVSDCEKEGGFR
jgi:hypothetical protein